MDRADLSDDRSDLGPYELRVVQSSGGRGACAVLFDPDLHRADRYSV